MLAQEFIDIKVKKWIYSDIEAGISNGLTMLVAQALMTYTEVLGGISRIVGNYERSVDVFGARQSRKNFSSFIPYLGKGYENVRQKNIFDAYREMRCCLVHQYLVNGEVEFHCIRSDPQGKGDYSSVGCGLLKKNGIVYFHINKYWQDFRSGVEVLRSKMMSNRMGLNDVINKYVTSSTSAVTGQFGVGR